MFFPDSILLGLRNINYLNLLCAWPQGGPACAGVHTDNRPAGQDLWLLLLRASALTRI